MDERNSRTGRRGGGDNNHSSDGDGVAVDLAELLSARVRIGNVAVRGLRRTKRDFVQSIIERSTADAGASGADGAGAAAERGRHDDDDRGGADTFEGVIDALSLSTERLRRTECFKAVDAYVSEGVSDDVCDVTVTVREAGPYRLSTGTSVETATGETSVELSGTFSNIFGRGEMLRGSAGFGVGGDVGSLSNFASLLGRGTSGSAGAAASAAAAASSSSSAAGRDESASNHVSAELSKPYPFGAMDAFASVRVGSSLLNQMETSSYSEFQRGAEAALDGPGGRLSYELTWRDLGKVARDASIRVREQAGHSVKGALRYAWEHDARDDAASPSEGEYARVSLELAGLGGDPKCRFAKSEIEAQYHVELAAPSDDEEQLSSSSLHGEQDGRLDGGRVGGLASDGEGESSSPSSPPLPSPILSLCVRAGGLAPLAGTSAADVRISDRFFVGGPVNLFRGFSNHGVGPTDHGDALGGAVFYKATAMLSLPLALNRLARLVDLRAHAFTTVGDCRELSELGAVGWREGMRAAAGLGVALSTTLGRIEINWTRVLRCERGDRAQAGFGLVFAKSFG